MSKTAMIRARMEPTLKVEAEAVLAQVGWHLSVDLEVPANITVLPQRSTMARIRPGSP